MEEAQSLAGRGNKGRTRGRPLKIGQGDIAAENQRARVRRAQRAFRERKVNYVTQLESRVSELGNIVEEMSNTFMGFTDRLLRSGNVDSEVTRDLKETLEKFLTLSHKAVEELDEEGNKEVMQDTEIFSISLEQGSLSNEMVMLQGGNTYAPTTSFQGVPASSAIIPNEFAQTQTRFDPHLNNIWSLSHISTDGSGAIPYILAGRDSFSSRLYFDTITTAVRSLKGDPIVKDVANSMLGLKLQYMTRGRLLSILGGVIEMMLHGTNKITTQIDAESEQVALARQAIIKEELRNIVLRRGESHSDYMDSWGVENYLGNRWRFAITSKMVRLKPKILQRENDIPMGPTIIPGFAVADLVVLDAQDLVERLMVKAVSIGEGPRWTGTTIDMAVQAFLQEKNVNYVY